MKPVLFDPEEMPDFVKHGVTYFGLQLLIGQSHFEMGKPEYRDLIGKSTPIIPAPIPKRYPLVNAEKVAVGILVGTGLLLDDHHEIIDPFKHPGREAFERSIDNLFKTPLVQVSIEPPPSPGLTSAALLQDFPGAWLSGRALPSHGRGHRFEPWSAHWGRPWSQRVLRRSTRT